MSLVQYNQLPSIERMRSEGVDVKVPEAVDPALNRINIGFLNMMPDAALTATERQFLRLLAANENVNCYFYPLHIASIERSQEYQSYTQEYYYEFNAFKQLDLDALVITGANVTQPLLANEVFWQDLIEVLEWSRNELKSTLCSCLATHAAMKYFYGQDRKFLGDKCWGVYQHDLSSSDHPLLHGVTGPIHMCHSRYNDISRQQFAANNIDVLLESEQVGVQLASEKNMKTVYFQGHPEYDGISLLKEYKREIIRYVYQQREDYPPIPEHYFNSQARALIHKYQQEIIAAPQAEALISLFPESELMSHIRNQWMDSAKIIFSNWVQSLLD